MIRTVIRTTCNLTLSASIMFLVAGIFVLAANDPTIPRPSGNGAGYALMQLLRS